MVRPSPTPFKMSSPTEYQGVFLPPLPEPFVWAEYGFVGGVGIIDRGEDGKRGLIVGAISSAGDQSFVQALPRNATSVHKVAQLYVATPQEAVPLLVSYVLLGITSET